MERSRQAEQIFRSDTGLEPKQEIPFSKIHAFKGLRWLLPAIFCPSYILLLAVLITKSRVCSLPFLDHDSGTLILELPVQMALDHF